MYGAPGRTRNGRHWSLGLRDLSCFADLLVSRLSTHHGDESLSTMCHRASTREPSFHLSLSGLICRSYRTSNTSRALSCRCMYLTPS